MRTLDSSRIRDSYVAILAGITPERRKDIWIAARQMLPEIADHLWEHFCTLQEDHEFQRNRDRIGGAMFFFLALVNAIMDKPVVPITRSLSVVSSSPFPSFGNLPSLR